MATAESTARKRRINAANKRERRGWREIKGVWPEEDPAYLDWIRTLPCAVCFLRRFGWVAWLVCIAIEREPYRESGPFWNHEAQRVTQAAHLGEIRGHGQKAADHTAGPLCGKHHDRGEP